VTRRSLTLTLLGLAAGLVAALSLAAPAAAATPCWKQLINDWYDGRVDKTYPAHCYQEARKHIPRDAIEYSDLPEDLDRALAAALGGGGSAGPNTPVRPGPGIGRNVEAAGTASDPVEGDDKTLLDRLAPANAESIPIPLLVLAGLALLLLAAAAASFVARRMHARRVPATPVTRKPPA
jgi:hypothetical protein